MAVHFHVSLGIITAGMHVLALFQISCVRRWQFHFVIIKSWTQVEQNKAYSFVTHLVILQLLISSHVHGLWRHPFNIYRRNLMSQ